MVKLFCKMSKIIGRSLQCRSGINFPLWYGEVCVLRFLVRVCVCVWLF